ncbi:MAG: ankyrin repeat domain-containing protein [Fibrobacter sp.]|nr:ankyrin repeat domain-containing protein [Fibrobacter sp.]
MNLIRASAKGDIKTVSALLADGAAVDEADVYGRTALIEAAWGGRLEVVSLLIEKGANVNIADKSGYSALMRAAEQGYAKIVSVLIKNGADVNCHGSVKGTTPLMFAAELGNLEVLQLLIDGGAKVNEPDQFQETALTRAYKAEQFKAAKLLESNGGRGKPDRNSHTSNEKEYLRFKETALPSWGTDFADDSGFDDVGSVADVGDENEEGMHVVDDDEDVLADDSAMQDDDVDEIADDSVMRDDEDEDDDFEELD